MRAIMLTGPAGTGKTALTRQIADSSGASYTFIQCTAGMDEGELLYKMLPSEETAAGVKVIPGKLIEAIDASTKGKSVLVLDEWDKTRPSADAFLLDFLQNARVSWRINGASMIMGNPANLVVFLTSNAEREFSEPLLRRVITIKLQALTPAKMAEVLGKYGVCNEHLPLLVQLYADTQAARLDKPATVQELVQLEQALHVLGESADWDQLVYSFVVKTDEAWEQLTDYLARAGNSRKVMLEKNRASIVEKYNEPAAVQAQEPAAAEEPRMPRFKTITRASPAPVLPVHVDENEEIAAILPDADFVATTAIVKGIAPAPGDDPARIGAFEVAEDGGKRVIVKRAALTLAEAALVAVAGTETYAEAAYPVTLSFINEIVSKSTHVSAWSNREIAGSFDGSFGVKKGNFSLSWKINSPVTNNSKIEIKGKGDVREIVAFLIDGLKLINNRLDMAGVVARLTAAGMKVPRCEDEDFINGDSLDFKPGTFRSLAPDVIYFTKEHNNNLKAWISGGKIVVTVGYALNNVGYNYHIQVSGGADIDGLIAITKMGGIRK
jgi:MoxR-like ATPase